MAAWSRHRGDTSKSNEVNSVRQPRERFNLRTPPIQARRRRPCILAPVHGLSRAEFHSVTKRCTYEAEERRQALQRPGAYMQTQTRSPAGSRTAVAGVWILGSVNVIPL